MRRVILILQIVLGGVLIANLLVWVIAQGSSHNIPLKTNLKFGLSCILIIAFIVIFEFIRKRKLTKDDKKIEEENSGTKSPSQKRGLLT